VFTLLNFEFGEPCEAGIQQGKGGGENAHGQIFGEEKNSADGH